MIQSYAIHQSNVFVLKPADHWHTHLFFKILTQYLKKKNEENNDKTDNNMNLYFAS